MTIPLTADQIQALIFRDDSELTAERSAYTRSIFSGLDPMFPRCIISASVAQLLAAAPNFYIQVIEETRPIYVLWIAKDWMESVTKAKNLTVTMRRVKAEYAAVTDEDRRIWRMAATLAKQAGQKVDVMYANLMLMQKEGGESHLRAILTQLQDSLASSKIYVKIYEEPKSSIPEETCLEPCYPQVRSERLSGSNEENPTTGTEET